MRLLYFIEPFPVRRRPLEFSWVAARWAKVARELTALGVCVDWACSDALAAALPELQATTPTSLEFSIADPPDDETADATWVQVMTDPEQPVWAPVVQAMLDRHRPDAIISWTVNAPLRALCAERGIVLMHQELGPLRSPLVPLFYADPSGVNGESSVHQLWPALCREPFTKRHELELSRWVAACYPLPTTRERVRSSLGLDGRRTIAVFGQVSRDSNVLAWSRIRTFDQLVALVHSAADRTKFQLVVKPHPAESSTVTLPPGVVLAPATLSAAELIAASDLCVTLNSSVGLEALLQAKPLYLLGRGPLSQVQAARDVEADPHALARRLVTDTPWLTSEEDSARQRLLHFLLLRYFTTGDALLDATSLLSKLEHWRALKAANAPLTDYFPSTNVAARLAEDLAWAKRRDLEAELAQRTAELEARNHEYASYVVSAQQELQRCGAEAEQQRRVLANLSAVFTQLKAEHDDLQNSAGVALLRTLQKLPLLYPTYLEAKRRLGREPTAPNGLAPSRE